MVTGLKSQLSGAPFRRALVIVSPNRIDPANPLGSPVLARAVSLAKLTGCSLELFDVCHELSLEQKLFASDGEVYAQKVRMADHEATQLAELTALLKREGLRVSHEVRWDHPRGDAILRKIDDAGVDLVIKAAGEHSYLLGLTTNTDWDLIRRSPAHLWFVKDGPREIGRMITAIGDGNDDGEADAEVRFISAMDYDVYRLAAALADALGAENTAVHAYQVPHGLSAYAAYSPYLGGVAFSTAAAINYPNGRETAAHELKDAIADEHGRALREFAQHFGEEPADMHIEQGHPSDVLPRVAVSLDADVLVMGARQLGRLERVFAPVNAEPTLAETPCDILFVKDSAGASVPAASEQFTTGMPEIDVEQAITDPQCVFSSPRDVACADQLSVPLRRRILQIWQQDLHAQMSEENEGGPVRPIDPGDLQEIDKALATLATEPDARGRTGNQQAGRTQQA